jgi:ABC-2 type transport system ATP-binding protein
MMTSALNINNLSKTYNGNFEALKGIDLSVDESDFFALLGPNGAGKSTCIGIICSLIQKTAGQVDVFGNDIFLEPEQTKKLVGLVPQEFNFNIFEPIEEIIINQAGYYGIRRTESYQRTKTLLKQLSLWDKQGQMARELSGGMKRRLMIARALVHRPKLLILDEPTAGVDIEIRRSMWDFLKEINQQGTTIILTTHYLEEAENLCRNIAIINQGNIVENTTMKKLLSQLDTEHFILDLNQSFSGELPKISPYVLSRIDDSTIEVESPKNSNLNQLFEKLTEHNISINSLRNKTNRLEELFLRLVQ